MPMSRSQTAPDEARAEPKQARARRTRTRILEIAAAAFAQGGYEGTSLNDIVRASGFTKGAFYFHFDSKEKLALATFLHKRQQLLERTLATVGEQPDALAELAEALRTRVRLLTEDPSLQCVLRLGAELGAVAGPESEFSRHHEFTIEYFTGLVRRGQAEGLVRPELDPRATGEGLFAAVVGTDRVSRLLSGRADLGRRTEDMLGLLVNGLAAPAPDSRTTRGSREDKKARGRSG